jgi:NTE family protein
MSLTASTIRQPIVASDDAHTTVSLVLGSGGARGLAHVGVIQWLVENGYSIRSIAGSSMGALVGGIFAAGKLDAYVKWVTALERREVLRLLDPAFALSGLIKGERIMGLLRDLVGDHDIEALPVSFTAVAMDLASGKEVWLRKGKLFDAIRASVAIPLVVTPYSDGDRTLIDGGVVNPVPIAPTLNDLTDITVAVSLGGRDDLPPLPGVAVAAPSATGADGQGYRARISGFIDTLLGSKVEKPDPAPGMLTVALASMESMQNTIARLKLAAYSPDVMIEVPRNACGFSEFWRAAEMIALGRALTGEAFARVGRPGRNEGTARP